MQTALVQQIERAVPLAEPDVRRILLELKRCIHKNRIFKAKTAEAIPALPAPLSQSIAEWHALRLTLERQIAEARTSYDRKRSAARESLQELLQEPAFLNGMVLSSRDCFETTQRYIATPVAEHTGRLAKSEYSVLQYVTRAMTKTSPFSSFTSVAGGFWEPGDGQALDLQAGGLQSLVRLNYLPLLRLYSGYIRQQPVRERLPVRLNPAIRAGDERLELITLRDDPKKYPQTYGTAENGIQVPLTPPVRFVMSILQRGPVSYRELVAALAQRSGSGKSDTAIRLINQLVDLGVLQVAVELSDQSPDLVADLLSLVERGDDPVSRELAPHLRRLRDLQDGFDRLGAEERKHCLQAVAETLNLSLELVGAEPFHGTVLYEDTTIRTDRAVIHTVPWTGVVEQLGLFQQLQPLLDFQVRFQAALAGRFAERYGVGGECDDVRPFLRESLSLFEDWIHDSGAKPDQWRLGAADSAVQELNRLTRELYNDISRLMRTPEPTVDLPVERMRGYVDRIPEPFRSRWASNSVFCQPYMDGRRLRAVVNHMYTGMGQFLSRFLPALDEAVQVSVREHIADFFPTGAMAVELPGAFGFNANVRPPLAPYVLGYPGSPSARPAAETVPLAELRFVHDPEAHMVRIYHKGSGREVYLLYLGFLVPFALPPLLRTLAVMAGNGMTLFLPHVQVEASLSEAERKRIRTYPRAMLGDVVLARRSWYAPEEEKPTPDPNETDFEYFRRAHEWIARHGIPQQVFVQQIPTQLLRQGFRTFDDAMVALRAKPQFIDFANPLLVRLLAKMNRDCPDHTLVVTEALPAMDRQMFTVGGQPFATELIVELNQRAARAESLV